MSGGVSRFFGLAVIVVVGVMLADLVANPTGTGVLTSSAISGEKAGLNALLGQPSADSPPAKKKLGGTVRYTVPGWPSSLLGHSAVTPHLNRLGGSGAVQYKDGLTGQPGTLPIPVQGPEVEQSRAGQAQMGLSRTSDAPGMFLPNLYYARPERDFWPGAGQPIALRSDNLMPVPATDPRGVPARLAAPIVQRGQRQIRQPANPVTWPAWGGNG